MDDISLRRQENQQILFMDEILSTMGDNSAILDAGCGNWSFDYRMFNFRIMAVDSGMSPAHSQLPPNAGFAMGDVEKLPVPAEVFDAVFFNWVLEHLRDPLACLNEARRVLKPQGLLYVSIPNGFGVEDRLYRLMFKGGGHIQQYSFQSFCRLAYKAGFRLTSFCEWPSGYTWMRGKPRLRQLTLKVLHRLRRNLGLSLAGNANWIFMLEKVNRRGFRSVSHTCTHCGGAVNIENEISGSFWTCPTCGGQNIPI